MKALALTKRGLTKVWHAIGQIKTWQLIVIFIGMVVFTSWVLRQNNLTMDRKRAAVLRIDEAGGDVKPALTDLADYIFNHMNTDMGQPLELVHSYNRAVEAAQAAAVGSSDGGIYAQAQAVCERRDIPLTARAQCIQEYVSTNSDPGTAPGGLNLPPKEEFTYSFYSPIWTPDLAGFSVLLTIAVFVLVISRFIATKIVKAATGE